MYTKISKGSASTLMNKMYNMISNNMTSLTVPTVCPFLMAIQLLGFCTFCSATIPSPLLCTVYCAVEDHVIIIA